MSSARPSNVCTTAASKVAFKFHDLEITREAVVLHFFEERTVIPLKDIASYPIEVVSARSDLRQKVLVP